MVLLSLKNDVACIKQLDLGGAFESTATDLADFGQTLNYLPIITTVEDVIDQLEHVDLVPLKEVIDVGSQKQFETSQGVKISYWDYVAVPLSNGRLDF